MVLIVNKKATTKQLDKIAKHFSGYIKIVLDIEKEILAGGADRHCEEEKALLETGSKQENLWGGGYDATTKEIDYNSIINLRPNQGNPSRDILAEETRKKFDNIVKKTLL